MRQNKSVVCFALAAIIIIVSGCTGPASGPAGALDKEALAKCLTEKGAKMYGASWCGHCNNQKAAFGDAFQYVDYVECDESGPDPNPSACAAAGVQAYPTWIIAGTQHLGEQKLEELAQLSGC